MVMINQELEKDNSHATLLKKGHIRLLNISNRQKPHRISMFYMVTHVQYIFFKSIESHLLLTAEASELSPSFQYFFCHFTFN